MFVCLLKFWPNLSYQLTSSFSSQLSSIVQLSPFKNTRLPFPFKWYPPRGTNGAFVSRCIECYACFVFLDASRNPCSVYFAQFCYRDRNFSKHNVYVSSQCVNTLQHGHAIHLIPKWRPINYSFVCMFISPLCFIFTSKFFCVFYMLTRHQGLINMQTKE